MQFKSLPISTQGIRNYLMHSLASFCCLSDDASGIYVLVNPLGNPFWMKGIIQM